MKVTVPRTLMVVILLVFLLGVTAVAGWAGEEDIEGSRDHPLISRYADSVIIFHEQTAFDKFFLPIDKYDDEG